MQSGRAYLDAARLLEGADDEGVGVLRVPVLAWLGSGECCVGMSKRRAAAVCTHTIPVVPSTQHQQSPRRARTTWARTWRASGPCCCCGGCGAARRPRWGWRRRSGPRAGRGCGPVCVCFWWLGCVKVCCVGGKGVRCSPHLSIHPSANNPAIRPHQPPITKSHPIDSTHAPGR